MNFIKQYIAELWSLTIEMAPYLLFGFLFAGLLHVFMKKDTVGRWLTGNNFRSVLNASLLGIPLPLCSCGVIPAGLSFHKNGASKGSTVSFLISTPQTGIDSIIATYAMLGLPFALIRPFVALVTGLAGGTTANLLDNKTQVPKTIVANTSQSSRRHPVAQAIHYGFVELIQDISKWLVIGLLLAALLAVVIPESFFTTYIQYPWLNMLLVLAASVPLYICATGSIPIAAVLMMKGLSPGAALVLLMAGPATNIATITVLLKSIGKKATAIYLGTIIIGAIFFGLQIDLLLPSEWFVMHHHHHSTHHHLLPEWIGVLSAITLIALIVNGYYSRWLTRKKERINSNMIHRIMNTEQYKVEGMTCRNCKAHVERDLLLVAGIDHVVADHETGAVTISGTNVDPERVKQAVENAGYVFLGKTKA
jgi:uncharacterized membrane protein YraQ (UPF0718 family)/copper chaperone CopZ